MRICKQYVRFLIHAQRKQGSHNGQRTFSNSVIGSRITGTTNTLFVELPDERPVDVFIVFRSSVLHSAFAHGANAMPSCLEYRKKHSRTHTTICAVSRIVYRAGPTPVMENPTTASDIPTCLRFQSPDGDAPLKSHALPGQADHFSTV